MFVTTVKLRGIKALMFTNQSHSTVTAIFAMYFILQFLDLLLSLLLFYLLHRYVEKPFGVFSSMVAYIQP